MLNNSERFIKGKSKSKVTITALAVTATILAGCGSANAEKGSNKPSKSTPSTLSPTQSTDPTHITPVTTTPVESTNFTSISYQTNPERNARINAAVQSFGNEVIKQSETPKSTWGPFDAFCSAGNYFGDDAKGVKGGQGWVKEGYKPQPGENCYVEHDSQFGGKDIMLGADVVVGANGKYTNQIEAVAVDNYSTGGVALITYEGPKTGWEVRDGWAVTSSYTTSEATSLSQAQTIDNNALAVLSENNL